MAKMKEDSKEYNDEAIKLALSRVQIFPCRKCGHPMIEGFCCINCGCGEDSDNLYPSIIGYKPISTY